MSAAELALFKSFLVCSNRYMEFGAGGSTYLAASLNKRVISTDSSDEWLAKVAAECDQLADVARPRLVKADIGPTGEWGAPTDPSTEQKWSSYYTSAWTVPGADESDLILIDGRFRIACFMATLLHCKPLSIILVHDFFSRPHYHVVRRACREVARAEEISAFQIPLYLDRKLVVSMLNEYKYDFH